VSLISGLQPCSETRIFSQLCCREHFLSVQCTKCRGLQSLHTRNILELQYEVRSHVIVSFRKKGKGSPYSITKRRVPELIPVLGSQPAGDVSHKPGDRLPLLSARPVVIPATHKRAATNFAAW